MAGEQGTATIGIMWDPALLSRSELGPDDQIVRTRRSGSCAGCLMLMACRPNGGLAGEIAFDRYGDAGAFPYEFSGDPDARREAARAQGEALQASVDGINAFVDGADTCAGVDQHALEVTVTSEKYAAATRLGKWVMRKRGLGPRTEQRWVDVCPNPMAEQAMQAGVFSYLDTNHTGALRTKPVDAPVANADL